MINILVTIRIPEANRSQALALLAELTAASKKEHGNHRYQYYLHPTDSNEVIITEQWENAEVLAAHEATAHFTTLLPQIQQLATDLAIEKY